MRDQAYFDQFNDKIDEEFNKQVQEAESGGNNEFEELPAGKYEVRIEDMLLKISKSGNLMLAITCKVIAGKYRNRLIWIYNVLKPQTTHFANEFLRSLESSKEVRYESEKQYAKLVDDIFNEIKDTKEYGLELKISDKGFKSYHIIKVFEAKDDELPFAG